MGPSDRVQQLLHVGPWEGAWHWVRRLSVAGARPSLKGGLGFPRVHNMLLYVLNLLLSIFHSMIKLLRIGAVPYLLLCHKNLTYYMGINTG